MLAMLVRDEFRKNETNERSELSRAVALFSTYYPLQTIIHIR